MTTPHVRLGHAASLKIFAGLVPRQGKTGVRANDDRATLADWRPTLFGALRVELLWSLVDSNFDVRRHQHHSGAADKPASNVEDVPG